jgi:glycosyltransferase involved in cell wall biosynthesis
MIAHPQKFPGKLGLQQRVLPTYRAPFFDLLARACKEGLSVFAGQPLPVEGMVTTEKLGVAQFAKARNLHFFDPSSPAYFCWQTGIIRWLDVCQPDCLVVEANPRYPSTRRAVSWMKRRGRPIFGWGLGTPRSGNAIDRLFRVPFLRSLDGVIAYSQRGAQEYHQHGVKRVFVAQNAVTTRPIVPPPSRLSGFGDQPKILFVGRLQARKRIDILLHACASLPQGIQPQLIIIGDGPARTEFESLAQEIYPQARFVGAKHGSELEPYYAPADLFALPGTGGLAVQQAMTYGLPVIVAKGDGTQDDLVRPENGWQVPPGDQTAFTAALCQALSDVRRLRRMGQESYRIVTEEINLEEMVDSFISALNQV